MDKLRETAEKLIKTVESDFIDIRLEERTSLDIDFATGSNVYPQSHSFIEEGGLIRVFSDGVWGIAGFVGIDGIEPAFKKALTLVDDHPQANRFDLPAVKPVTDIFNPPVLESLNDVLLKDKEFLCRRYAELLDSASRDISASASYSEYIREKTVINNMGTDITEIENICGLHLQMNAPSGISRNISCRGGFENVRNRENSIEDMITEFSNTRNSETIEAGMHRVILHPELTGILVHEAIGHLSEADTRLLLPAFDDILAFGTRIGPEQLGIIDDSSYFEMPGSYAWDDEGTAGQRTVLVKKGKTSGILHSMHTAGNAGAANTGNARASRITSPPSVRTSCTFMLPGDLSLDSLFQKMGTGLYLKGVLSGSADFNKFSVTCESAWKVNSGVTVKSVEPVTISGRIFDILNLINGIANDKILYSGMGGGFKDTYCNLPISYGGPHILIDKVHAR